MEGELPARCLSALSFFTAPSSWRIFVLSLFAIKSATSSGISRFKSSAFLRIIATLVSNSGVEISARIPDSNRLLSLSVSVFTSFGGRSDVITICFPSDKSLLNVWKNSSWVLSFPLKNWISSISKTSAFLYLSWKASVFFFCMQEISSLPNSSLVTYIMLLSGWFNLYSWHIAIKRWVFPRPESPYINSGFILSSLSLATALQAAYANSFDLPTIKVSKVYSYFALSNDFSSSSCFFSTSS